jgi:hypothetical protein
MGKRVGAILSANEDTVKFLGWGEYIGEEIPSEEVGGFMGQVMRQMGKPNPCILLDNGKKVYGCECWWGPEERIKKEIGDRKIIEVDIDEVRREEK